MQLQQGVRLPTLPASAQKCPPLTRMASTQKNCRRRVCVVSQALNKTTLVEAVHKECPNLTKTAVNEVVTALIDTVVKNVAAGETVSVLGFGKFEMRQREARTGRDPRNGTAIEIPASKSPKFTAGKSFKETVSGKAPATKASATKVAASSETKAAGATKAKAAGGAKSKKTEAKPAGFFD